jgi:hypothetical protein
MKRLELLTLRQHVVVEEIALRLTGIDHVETIHDKLRRQQVEVERLGRDGRPLTPPRA